MLLLETLEKILPKVKKYIVDSSDGSVDIKMFDPNLITGSTVNNSSNDTPSNNSSGGNQGSVVQPDA